jgi:hypothetical protein
MPAFVISHKGAVSCENGTRDLLAERIARLWGESLQLDGSSWIVSCSALADDIRDELAGILREGDALIVVKAGSEAAWAGLESTDSDWLVEHL